MPKRLRSRENIMSENGRPKIFAENRRFLAKMEGLESLAVTPRVVNQYWKSIDSINTNQYQLPIAINRLRTAIDGNRTRT